MGKLSRTVRWYGDLACGVIIALIAGSTGLFSFSQLRQIERGSTVVAASLPKAPTIYLVYQGDNCVGRVSTGLLHDEAFFFEGFAEVYVSAHQSQQIFRLESRAYFNPLGQLTEASAKISAASPMLTVQARGVHTITIDFTLFDNDRELPFRFSVDGPVLVASGSSDTWVFRYPPREQRSATLPLALSQLGGLPALRLELPTEGNSSCPTTERGTLDLTPLLSWAKQITSLTQGRFS